MKRAFALGLAAVFLSSLTAGAQELETKVKGTGKKVELKKSGSKWEVGDTGKKVELERSGSEIEVKGTDVKLEPDGKTKWAAEEAKQKAEEAKEKAEEAKEAAEDLKDKLGR